MPLGDGPETDGKAVMVVVWAAEGIAFPKAIIRRIREQQYNRLFFACIGLPLGW
jgi:hypothetical protein